MPFSTGINNSILNHFTGKATWAAPAATYIGVSSSTPTPGGSNVTEPTVGGYVRQQVTTAQWTDATAGAGSAIENNAEKAFPQATADYYGAGVNATHMVIYTASTAGTFLGFKALTVAKPILNGDTMKFPVGDIDLVMGGT